MHAAERGLMAIVEEIINNHHVSHKVDINKKDINGYKYLIFLYS